MKKSIFAVLAVTAMGASHAQTADTSSVSLYGVIDEGYLSQQKNADIPTARISENKDYRDVTKFSHSRTGISSGNTSATFIGIRTNENLGNGVNAKAAIEFGFTNPHNKLDEKTGKRKSETDVDIHQAYVGLHSKDFGSLTIGRLHNKTYDFLGSEGLGSGSLPGSVFSNRITDLDHGNVIRYSIGNEVIAGYVSYGQENQKTTINGGQNKGTATYSSHLFEVAAEAKYQNAFGKIGFIKNHGSQVSSHVLSSPGLKTELKNEGIYLPKENAERINQSFLASIGYDFGIIKPSYTYLQNKQIGEWHTKSMKETYHQLSFTAPVTGTINLYGSYYIKDASGEGVKDLGALSTKNGNGWQVGTTYHLSKRTNLYAAYGQESYDYKYAKKDALDVTGKVDNKAYTVGLKHVF